jgi:hypothetical protein
MISWVGREYERLDAVASSGPGTSEMKVPLSRNTINEMERNRAILFTSLKKDLNLHYYNLWCICDLNMS